MAKIRALLVATVLAFSGAGFTQFFGEGGGSSSAPWTEFKLNPKTRIKLDFRNSNVDMVIDLFSRTSGVTIVKDPTLTGPITVTSAKPLPLADAFEVLSATLKLKGFEIRKEGKLLVIRNTRNQNQGGRGGGGNQGGGMNPMDWMGSMSPDQMREMFGSSSILKVYPIKYANASQVARVINDVFSSMQNPMDQFLQQMMSGGNQGGGGRGPGNNRFNRFGFNQMGRGAQTVRASSDDFSNSVIVNAPQKEQQQVEGIIKQIDRETEAPLSPKVYKLQYATATDIAPAIQNVLTANAPKGRGGAGNQNIPIEQRFQQAFRFGTSQAAFGTVVTEARTNSLIVTATEENLKLVDNVVKELDVEVKLEATTFVFPLNNARADQIATLMNQAFGTRTGANGRTNTGNTRFGNTGNTRQPNTRTGGGGMGGGFGGGNLDNGQELMLDIEDPETGTLETNVVAQGGGFNQIFGGGQNRQGTGTTGRDNQGRLVQTRELQNQITVIPDQNTNSLIVVTSPDNIELLRQILDQLDKIPEQVMIETIIVEATLDSSSKLGVEWNFSKSKAFNDPNLSNTGSQGFGLQTANPALQGFRYTLTGRDFSVFLNALQTDQKFQVLSTPRIFTSNNSEAVINISQRVPYVLSTREDPNGNLTFTYAFQDVGIVLTVTPRITSNGYVTMDINQQANDLQGFTSFNAPIINTREADTTVSVKDGETIILGGIIRNQVTSTVKKIPLLGDLPLLGKIFRSTDKGNVKTELMIFMTPRVVRDPEEARKLYEQEQNRLSKETQKSLNKAKGDPSEQSKVAPKSGGDPGKSTGGGGSRR